ncbi:MAG TPA: VOC family protein [Chloroflexota bacterium]|nr:VOC family protein [Chloroflexota bacterium]
MIHPTALAEAHMECRELSRTLPVLTDILAFEKVRQEGNIATLKHPNTPWLLVLHEVGADAPDKPAAHHMGVRVEHQTEVDAAWKYITEHQDQYGLYGLREPVWGHGSYSLHFVEPGGNDWEIECYEAVLRKESGGQRLGGVRSRHWDTPFESERFESHGYVPQAFTHGTLHTDNAPNCEKFVKEVLGLDAHQAYTHVIYTKHPDTKHFVVCLEGGHRNQENDNFRFTLTVDSPQALSEAHAWLDKVAPDAGLTDLSGIKDNAFLLRDPDNNCWEIAAR